MRAAKVLARLHIFASLTATESPGRDKVLHDARHGVRSIVYLHKTIHRLRNKNLSTYTTEVKPNNEELLIMYQQSMSRLC